MLDVDAEQRLEIRSVLIWQVGVVALGAVVAMLVFTSSVSVMFGGLLVALSTWHVHRSIYASGGDRMQLLKSAGIRFALFLLVLAAGVFFLDLQPLYLISGMALAYAAMYLRSLLLIIKKMKGDSLG